VIRVRENRAGGAADDDNDVGGLGQVGHANLLVFAVVESVSRRG